MAEHARSVSHLAVGNHAAADSGVDGDSVLRKVSRALSGCCLARRRAGRRRDGVVGRPRLLLARTQSAPMRAGGRRAAWRRVSRIGRRTGGIAGHRPLDGGGDRLFRVRRARDDSRRQREARAGARVRRRRFSGRKESRERDVDAGGIAAAVQRIGRRRQRVHARLDGSRRDVVRARQAGLPALPVRRRLRGQRDRTSARTAHGTTEERPCRHAAHGCWCCATATR